MNIDEVRDILSHIQYKDWRLEVSQTRGGDIYLQVQFAAPDSVTGVLGPQHGRKWHVSSYAVRSEVVYTALKAVITAEEHEVRENFSYKGQRIFNAHYDVNILAEICEKGSDAIKDVRPAPPASAGLRRL